MANSSFFSRSFRCFQALLHDSTPRERRRPMKPSANARRALFCLTFWLLVVVFVNCGGGRGGGSPTAPGPAVPSVAGDWTGTWGIEEITVFSLEQRQQIVTFDISMSLSQSGSQVSGRIDLLESGGDPDSAGSGEVEGTVSTAGVFTFNVLDPETPCGTFNGELTLSSDRQELGGNAVADTSACSADRFRMAGPMSLQRQ